MSKKWDGNREKGVEQENEYNECMGSGLVTSLDINAGTGGLKAVKENHSRNKGQKKGFDCQFD